MYGGATRNKLDENSMFDPKSPYAVSKVFAHDMTKVYRDSITFFAQMEFYLIMNLHIEERLLLLEKLQKQLAGYI